MKNTGRTILLVVSVLVSCSILGQNSFPRPGIEHRPPRPPRPLFPPSFGIGDSYHSLMPQAMMHPNGEETVMCCGYDAMGIWRTMPLRVKYDRMGINYDVTVMSAWNPWSDQWDEDVDVDAVNTYYYFNGRTYRYYVVLSTGTFYFNL